MFNKKRPTSYLATSAAYTQFQTLKWIGIAAIIIFAISSFFTMFFLYRNVYVPIGSTENLDITDPLQVQVIDFKGLTVAEKLWNDRATTATPLPSKDPFYGSLTSTLPVSTSQPSSPTSTSSSPKPQTQIQQGV